MQRLKDLSKKVQAVLEKDEASRNSDNVLLLHLLREIGKEQGVDVDTMSLPMYLLHGRDMNLPTLESVGRARRKVQAAHPELRGDDDVEACREELEEAYRRFAREVHYG
jgi:hypothetical protein